jgi:tRNA dimethylallyltransferase
MAQEEMKYNCVAVIGPTASGKTRVACRLAHALDGEVISADSRQVYRGLDIGTGKDLSEYTVNGRIIPHHLIDIIDPQEQYYLHDFIRDLRAAFFEIRDRGHLPVVCGGTGLYLDALGKDHSLTQIGEDPLLRSSLAGLPKETLLERLDSYRSAVVARADRTSVKRIIRAIEIAAAMQHGHTVTPEPLPYRPFYIGINTSLDSRRENISQRLKRRIDTGLVDETRALLARGISRERLDQLGLEYRYCAMFVEGQIPFGEFHHRLETAIFQFAKRQMTWFRKMEREGVKIHWFDAGDFDEIISAATAALNA